MLHQFIVRVAMRDVEDAIEKLNEAGIYNTSYETPIDVIETTFGYDYQVLEEKTIDLHIFAEEENEAGLPDSYFSILQQTLSIPKERIRHSIVEDLNWQNAFEEIDLGNGWFIAAPGSEIARQMKERAIVFDPQGAFGTGLHGTTQDCLRMILQRDFQDQKVLDLGTGSGILSIAVQLRGAVSALAVDIAPVREQIHYNASLNEVDGIDVLQQDILDEKLRFSVEASHCIFINIGGEETLKFIEKHGVLERYDGPFLISGLVEWSFEKALAPFFEANYSIEQRLQTDEWVTVWLTKQDEY